MKKSENSFRRPEPMASVGQPAKCRRRNAQVKAHADSHDPAGRAYPIRPSTIHFEKGRGFRSAKLAKLLSETGVQLIARPTHAHPYNTLVEAAYKAVRPVSYGAPLPLLTHRTLRDTSKRRYRHGLEASDPKRGPR